MKRSISVRIWTAIDPPEGKGELGEKPVLTLQGALPSEALEGVEGTRSPHQPSLRVASTPESLVGPSARKF